MNVLEPGELLRSIHLPASALEKRFAFRRTSLTHLGRSAALVVGTADQGSDDFLLTITAATAKPVQLQFDRMPSAGALRRAIDAAIHDADWFDDVHGSAPYKRHLTYYYAEQIRAELAATMNLTVNGKKLSAEPAPGPVPAHLLARAGLVRRQEGLRPGRLRRLHGLARRRAVP